MKNQLAVDTVIVSDLHLGSRDSQPAALLQALDGYRFSRLILNGDIVSSVKKIHTLSGDGQRFWSFLKDLQSRREVETIWVLGNHDPDPSYLMQYFPQINVCTEYRWRYGAKHFLALHGHDFDSLSKEHPYVIAFFDYWERLIRIFDRRIEGLFGPKQFFLQQIKKRSRLWQRTADVIAQKALAFAHLRRIDAVFCGHVHQASCRRNGSVTYYNTGSWIDIDPTLVVVGDMGVMIHRYSTGGELVGLIDLVA